MNRTILLGLALVIALQTISAGQPAIRRAIPPYVRYQRIEADAADKTFSFKFNGGIPEELIDMIQSVIGRRPNLIVQRGAQGVKLPALQLSDVTLRQFFEVLTILLQGTGAGVDQFGNPIGQPGGRDAFLSEVSPGIWILSRPLPGVERAPAIPRTVKVFYIGEFLTKYKIEDITTAIQSAMELLPGSAKVELKFHPETKLLITALTDEQAHVLEGVLRELQRALLPPSLPSLPPAGGKPNKL